MRAEAARKLSKRASFPNLEKVFKSINSAAEKAETKCFFYTLLTNDELKELKELGYTVTQDNHRNDPLVTIDWKKEITPGADLIRSLIEKGNAS